MAVWICMGQNDMAALEHWVVVHSAFDFMVVPALISFWFMHRRAILIT